MVVSTDFPDVLLALVEVDEIGAERGLKGGHSEISAVHADHHPLVVQCTRGLHPKYTYNTFKLYARPNNFSPGVFRSIIAVILGKSRITIPNHKRTL